MGAQAPPARNTGSGALRLKRAAARRARPLPRRRIHGRIMPVRSHVFAALTIRTTNDYGKTARERDLVMRHIDEVEPLVSSCGRSERLADSLPAGGQSW